MQKKPLNHPKTPHFPAISKCVFFWVIALPKSYQSLTKVYPNITIVKFNRCKVKV